MVKRILLTGGRAPATLELARLFSKAGHVVYLAESVRFPVARFSRSITNYVNVPMARLAPGAYAEALASLIVREKIDIYIPTCEEIFYTAKVVQKFPATCMVWTDTFEKLDLLHNKWTFIEHSKKFGSVPVTQYAASRESLVSLCKASKYTVVLKPAYSRFASQTHIINFNDIIPFSIQPTAAQPWVVQQFIDGRHLCSYSLVHEGALLAHALYPSQQQWGIGSSTVFESIEHPVAQEWVKQFVAETIFTGQIGFDFIQIDDGTLYPIECNPRATSGAHLFRDTPELVVQFVEANHDQIIIPHGSKARSIKLALVVRFVRLLLRLRPLHELQTTMRFLRHTSDVLYEQGDAVPVIGQFISVFEFLFLSTWHGISATEVATYDIGYNGIVESTESHASA